MPLAALIAHSLNAAPAEAEAPPETMGAVLPRRRPGLGEFDVVREKVTISQRLRWAVIPKRRSVREDDDELIALGLFDSPRPVVDEAIVRAVLANPEVQAAIRAAAEQQRKGNR